MTGTRSGAVPPESVERGTPLLAVRGLCVSYGSIPVLHDISMEVREGEIVALIGANGAGKSTLLRTVSGIVSPAAGRIEFLGRDLAGVPPHRIVERGIAHVPEGRAIFGNLTVIENLKLAAWCRRNRRSLASEYDRVFALFPRLAERREQISGTLSGGEQQMLAVGRALMTGGRLLILDEPSMGLAPILVREIFSALRGINEEGTTILLVEQNARLALKHAGRGYVLEGGRIVLTDAAAALLAHPRIEEAYLGA